MRVIPICQLPGEAALLRSAVNDFSLDGPRSHYAEWLESKGEVGRANTVRATLKAYHTLNENELADLAGELNWQRMLAIPILKHLIQCLEFHTRDELESLRDLIFPKLRPAINLTYSAMKSEPELGLSRLWGLPDLPKDQTWPKVSELSNWYKAKDTLPHQNHCAFIGQFSWSDFKDSVYGQDLPKIGGVAVFAYIDINHGIVETVTRLWDNQQPLSRRTAPLDLLNDEANDRVNAPMPVHAIELTECLSLPDATGGPFTADIPLCGWGEPFHDTYSCLIEMCGGGGLGFGGYLSGTSGEDPSLDTKSRCFAILRTTPDAGIVHFSIPENDIETGCLDNVKYVWNDWDS